MRKRLFLFACLFLVGVGLSYAQSVSISGRVLSGSDGQPIIGATVTVSQTGTGAVADVNGNFTVNAATGALLTFRAIGYETVEVPAQNGMTVRMRPDDQILDEVIITAGFGTGRTGATLVSNVTRVDGEILANRPVANVLDALQGQVPGLAVFTSSGEPSAMSTIRLHGAGTLSASTAPLFVVDGLPVEGTTIRALNPNDFESVTILRDASATAIYGARAANGVIFITTRSGVIGQHGTVRVSGNMGFSQLASRSFFESMMTADELRAMWVAMGWETQAWADQHRIDFPHNTRWDKVYMADRAPTNALDVSFSGGGGRTNYFLSAGRTVQEGLAYRSRYERLSFRSNLNSQLNDWLRVGANVSLSVDDWLSNPNFHTNQLNGGLSFLFEPWFSRYDADGNQYTHRTIPGVGVWDPEVLAHNVTSPMKGTFLNTVAFVELRPITGLTMRSQVGMDGMDHRTRFVRLPSWGGSTAANNWGMVREEATRRTNMTFTNTAEYKFSIHDDNNIAILAGHEFVNHRWSFFEAEASGFRDDRLLLLQVGNNPRVGSNAREFAFLSFFGRAEYNFRETYFLDVSLRNDASSRFGRENRNAMFWSVGTMWHLHREAFIQDIHWLNELTARLSVGTSGNSDFTPGNLFAREYGHLALVGTTDPYAGSASWFLQTPGNPFLTWEEQTLYTLNIRTAVFNRRLRANIDLYSRVTSAMLIDVPQPHTVGFINITENTGRLANRGVSFRIDGDIWMANRGRSFFTPYIAFNYNRETVLELFGDRDYWMIPNTGIGWVVGQPRTLIYPLWAGVNPETGAPQWYRPAPEGGLSEARRDPNDLAVGTQFNQTALQQNTGKALNAPINGGWGFSAGHAGFTLQADFSFSLGKYLLVNDFFFSDNPNAFGMNARRITQDFWTPDNPEARFPSPRFQFSQFDDRIIENASFMRLKNLSLGYSIPTQVLQRTNFFTDARLFVTGRNLLTITNFTGLDPEVDSNLTLGMVPNTRQFSVGFDISF